MNKDHGKQEAFSPVLVPVPMGQIFKKDEETKPTEFTLNSEGQLILRSYPSNLATIFMLPIFGCIGCCVSKTSCVVIDDNKKTINAEVAMGHCFIFGCCRSRNAFSYDDVANIGFTYAGVTDDDAFQKINPVIVFKNGIVIPFASCNYEKQAQKDVLGLHYFMFGRSNPNYKAPMWASLCVPPQGCC